LHETFFFKVLFILVNQIRNSFSLCACLDFISGVRFNYLTILLIAGITFWSSCFIAAGGIAHYLVTRNDNEWWLVILASLSPLISFCILIFPIPVEKATGELGFILLPSYNFRKMPEHEYKQLQEREAKIGCWEKCKYDMIKCSENCRRNKGPAEVKITKVLSLPNDYPPDPDRKYFISRHLLLFYPCGMCRLAYARMAHVLFHFLAVGVGLGFGWATVIRHYSEENYSRRGTVELTFTLISIVCVLAFLVSGGFDVSPKHHNERGSKRMILYFEFLGLFFYMMALLYVSVVAGGLIYGDPCPVP